jgi:hypothetical protein
MKIATLVTLVLTFLVLPVDLGRAQSDPLRGLGFICTELASPSHLDAKRRPASVVPGFEGDSTRRVL